MNTGAFMHDLLDWIDNNLIAVWTLSPSPGDPATRNGTSSACSKNIRAILAGYIRAQKLQKSVERLTRSDEPILNVAIALGFDSQQSFNRSFKRQYGQAPGHGGAVWVARKRSNYASNPGSAGLIQEASPVIDGNALSYAGNKIVTDDILLACVPRDAHLPAYRLPVNGIITSSGGAICVTLVGRMATPIPAITIATIVCISSVS
jgi:AraC family transcriptional activator of mar-sox-rob regulon